MGRGGGRERENVTTNTAHAAKASTDGATNINTLHPDDCALFNMSSNAYLNFPNGINIPTTQRISRAKKKNTHKHTKKHKRNSPQNASKQTQSRRMRPDRFLSWPLEENEGRPLFPVREKMSEKIFLCDWRNKGFRQELSLCPSMEWIVIAFFTLSLSPPFFFSSFFFFSSPFSPLVPSFLYALPYIPTPYKTVFPLTIPLFFCVHTTVFSP